MSQVNEKWRPVVGYEGCYEVSDLGRVRSLTRPSHSNRILKGRVLRQGVGGHGYAVVTLWLKGKSRGHLVHRVVAAAFIGPAASKMDVNHRDGKKLNNYLKNLEYTSRGENMRLAYKNGQVPRGENHAFGKLKDIQVAAIRHLRGLMSQADIAECFGVSQTLVWAIHKNKRRRVESVEPVEESSIQTRQC